ncbi:hypothetical protein E2C01_037213 [Portunus trituberculatus]|uniref:Uncharacterized protein n=1 Tax=Portunus trituberculatus TaxID=210409 RepID=A0A5B7FEP9_PORTR|nr:hypothetical protein [Portunus trituberculatus]
MNKNALEVGYEVIKGEIRFCKNVLSGRAFRKQQGDVKGEHCVPKVELDNEGRDREERET